MSRSLKLGNNDYWDSTSVMHNKKRLNQVIDNVPFTFIANKNAVNGNNNIYAKIATYNYSEGQCASLLFFATGTYDKRQKTGLINVIIQISGNKVSIASCEVFAGTELFDPNDVITEYSDTEKVVNIWVKLDGRINNFNITILYHTFWQFFGDAITGVIATETTLPSPNYQLISSKKTY